MWHTLFDIMKVQAGFFSPPCVRKHHFVLLQQSAERLISTYFSYMETCFSSPLPPSSVKEKAKGKKMCVCGLRWVLKTNSIQVEKEEEEGLLFHTYISFLFLLDDVVSKRKKSMAEKWENKFLLWKLVNFFFSIWEKEGGGRKKQKLFYQVVTFHSHVLHFQLEKSTQFVFPFFFFLLLCAKLLV